MKCMILVAALAIAPATYAASAKVQSNPCKPKPAKTSAAKVIAKRLAVMTVAGALSFYIGDIAIGCFKQTNPLTHPAFDAFPSKVFFSVLGALAAYGFDKCRGAETDVCDAPQTQMQGMPKKDPVQQPGMPICVGNCC